MKVKIVLAVLSIILLCCACEKGEVEKQDIIQNTSLTQEQAYELIVNAKEELFKAFASGFYELEFEEAYKWASKSENRIILPKDYSEKRPIGLKWDNFDYYVDYCDSLKTVEAFDSYYSRIFTEETISVIKSTADIAERNGKLSGYSAYYNKGAEPQVISVAIDNGTAIIKCKEMADFGYELDKEYVFKYSDEFGWIFELTNAPEISDMQTLEKEYMCRNIKDFLPEEAGLIERSSDCYNPILTGEVALETYLAYINHRYIIYDFGIEDYALAATWSGKGFGRVSEERNEWGWLDVYLAPSVDTIREFDTYFTQIFTEEALDSIKESCYIKELDGRLIMPDIDGKHSNMIDHSLSKIEGIEQNENTAICTISLYDFVGNFHRTTEVTLVYSDEYGWRFHTESPLFS